MAQDILQVLPFEIWERCIAEACLGERYMANLLIFTMISTRWCRFITEAPTLWATIHVNDADEDSMATIALFLHLSRQAQLSLRVWAPLSESWNNIYSMIFSSKDRIREVILQTDSQSHLADCSFNIPIGNAELRRNLQQIFKTLGFPVSIEHLDLNANRPVRMDPDWVPPNLISAGNWVVPSHFIELPARTILRLRHLSVNAIDLVSLFPYLSALGHLQHLHLYSTEQEYILPPPSRKTVVPPNLPVLSTLRHHGRFYWAPTQLLSATARTVQYLELRIGILDLGCAIYALGVGLSLRRFSLTLLLLEHDLDDNNKQRSYSPISIKTLTLKIKVPKWRLKRLEDFRCEVKPIGQGQIPKNLELDHLWHLFHTIFPRLHSLVWNAPIQSGGLLLSLLRQTRLRHFESNAVPALPSRLPEGFTLSALEYLRIKDLQMFRGVVIANLTRFSALCKEDFRRPVGFTFTLLRSLDLTISESVENPCHIIPGDFPILKVLTVTFLGPRGEVQLPDLPSLTQVTVSTRSPTFSQGTKFCAAFVHEPRKCPKLEQINLDSFLEWDILYLLLRKRNFLQDTTVSRIKRLSLPLLPPKFRLMFISLLAIRNVSSPPFCWSTMVHLSIEETQSPFLDKHLFVIPFAYNLLLMRTQNGLFLLRAVWACQLQ
jgi:hypothetical protein